MTVAPVRCESCRRFISCIVAHFEAERNHPQKRTRSLSRASLTYSAVTGHVSSARSPGRESEEARVSTVHPDPSMVHKHTHTHTGKPMAVPARPCMALLRSGFSASSHPSTRSTTLSLTASCTWRRNAAKTFFVVCVRVGVRDLDHLPAVDSRRVRPWKSGKKTNLAKISDLLYMQGQYDQLTRQSCVRKKMRLDLL